MMILQETNEKPLKKIRASMIERISNETNKTLMVSMPTNEVASGTTITLNQYSIPNNHINIDIDIKADNNG